MSVGDRIRAARKDRRMTLAALAVASGLTKGFISQVESGNSGVSLVSLERIAAALQVSLTSLMPSEGNRSAAIAPDGAPEPTLIAARNLYQESAGLARVTAAQHGTHYMATLPPYSMLTPPHGFKVASRSEGILVMLQGTLLVCNAPNEVRVSRDEVASWDCASAYSLENPAAAPARALIFLPDGVPLPALAHLPDSARGAGSADYSAALQGPMRLVEMRARRQAERRR